MTFRSGDAAIFFRDSEDLATLTGDTTVTFPVQLEYPEEIDQFSGQSRIGMVAAKPKMTYETAAPGRALSRADYVTIGNVRYQVQAARKIDDGVLSQADLMKV
jgi:hypothetical protein